MACFGLSAAALPQGFELSLRSGRTVLATALQGDNVAGFRATVAGAEVVVAAADLVAISGVAAKAPDLGACYLVGGDIVRGTVLGGDANGHKLELVSPVFGRIELEVDRLQALVGRGGPAPEQLPLPSGVEEALFVPTAVGFDLVAGTLHQFGEPGIRFQPDGANSPRWFAASEFVALRLAAAAEPPSPPPVRLLTRAAERVSAVALRCDSAGIAATLVGGAEVKVAWRDLAAATFTAAAISAADLTPQAVDEAGFGGEVVWPWQRDQNVAGGPLVAGGRTFARGLGVHSRSRVVFVVPAGCTHFWTRVACDDSAAALPLQPQASARVVVGNTVVFRADDLRPGSAPLDSGLLAVQPGDQLALEVDFGGGRDLGDRVDWLLPMFLGPQILRGPEGKKP